MPPRIALLVLAAAVAAFMTPRVGAQTPRLHSIHATVLDGAKAPIAGLGAGDFELLVDDKPVAIARVAPAAPELNVILMVDATTSQPLRRYEINAAIKDSWLPSLIAGDRARVGTIGASLTLTAVLPPDPTLAFATARTAVERAAIEPSPIWDAIDAAITALEGSTGKLVIVLTDGRASGNRIGLEDAARRAADADVAISSISEAGEAYLPQTTGSVARFRSDESLKWLAAETGGLCLLDGIARRTLRPQIDAFAFLRETIETPNRPGPLMAQIMAASRRRYVVTFPFAADGKVHGLTLRTRVPDATVLARRTFR